MLKDVENDNINVDEKLYTYANILNYIEYKKYNNLI